MLATKLRLQCLRRFSTTEKRPNIVQLMPEYQRALDLASKREYIEALRAMNESITQIEN